MSDGEGRQVATVFTMDARLVERFAEADRTIISAFEFTDSSEQQSNEGADAETARKPTNTSSQAR
jgi:hypothetical protein